MADAQNLSALLDQTPWIHALARQLVSDPHLAADLAQDTCVEALEHEPEASRPLRGWLARVMRNQLAKLRRGGHNRRDREAQREAELAPAAGDVVERAEAHKNLVQAVLALDEPYRRTLLMRFFEQLPYDEIARQTGVTRAAVNSRITRGLTALRERLETTYGGDRRALGLALLPLAKLPTGLATSTTLLTTLKGLKTMQIALGIGAASLLLTTVSVSLFSGGREPAPTSAPAFAATTEFEPTEGGPVLIEPGVARETLEAVEELVWPQREQEHKDKHKEKHKESDEKVWKTELFNALPLSPTVKSLAVNTGAGEVEVLASTSGRVEVQAKVRAKLGKVKEAQLTQVFEDHVTIEEEGGVLTIEDAHKGTNGWTVSLVVSVPGRLPLSANSGAGDVTVRTGTGRIQANSGAGDVLVKLANERLESMNANSGAGEVVAEVGSVEEELRANSGAGDVTLLISDPSSPGEVGMNSGAGDVTLYVPANIVGSFDLETMSDIELPASFGIEVKEDISGQQKARGTLGSGGGEYQLRSGAGDLRIVIGSVLPAKN